MVKVAYLEANKNFKSLCRTKRKLHYKYVVNSLGQVKDAKQFWNSMKSFKNTKSRLAGNISCVEWVEYFKNLLNPLIVPRDISYTEQYIFDNDLDKQFNQQELQTILAKLKDGKAPGFDGVPYDFFKNGPRVLSSKLLAIFNKIYMEERVLESFKKSIIFPLHKKGDVNCVQNYRGLSFIDCIAKVFASLLHNRLNNWVHSHQIISEFQAGFRKGYSTIDNIFNLTSMIQLQLSKKGAKLYCFFVDFSSAFDTIDRKALYFKLSCLGVSSHMLNIIKELYKGTTSGVWCNAGVTKCFETNMGLKQGCILSPLLFSLFVNDLADILDGGCDFEGFKVSVLLYADDIVILSPTPGSLQSMINKLENYCNKWNLRVNLSKSKIMVFRKGGQLCRNEKWWYKRQRVEVVNKYKYLGVILTPSLSWETQFKDKSMAAKYAINAVWHNLLGNERVPLSAKFTCFNSIVKAILCYSSQVWGYKESDELEGVFRLFIKRIFKLPNNTPNYVLFLETGFEKVYLYTLRIHLNFLLRVVALPKNRLPNILAKQIIKSGIYWYQEWKVLGYKYGIDVDMSNIDRLREQMLSVIEAVRVTWEGECLQRARNATYHKQYRDLDFQLCSRLVLFDKYDIQTISWIIKARAELVDLNYKPWCNDKIWLCSLCNINENETVYHFIARCPILADIRNLCFFKRSLNRGEFELLLNGRNWWRLGKFMKIAWKFRWELINEFNF